MPRLDAATVDARPLALSVPILEDYERTAGPNAAAAAWVKLAFGPIGRTRTPLVLSGSPRQRRRSTERRLAVVTWSEHRRHLDFSVTLFGLVDRPGGFARRLELPPELEAATGCDRLYIVYALAWRRRDGPWAEWRADPPQGQAALTFCFPTANARAEDLAELGRCADLLLGRHAKPGRPSRYTDPAWRTIAEAAEARKAEYPSLPWDAIARSYGVQVRTLRVYRADLRRELEAPIMAPTLVQDAASSADGEPSDTVSVR